MDRSSELGYYYPLDSDVDASYSSLLKHHHRDSELQVSYEELVEKYKKCEEELKKTSLKLQESEEENEKLKSEAKKTKSDHRPTDTEYRSLVRELDDENEDYDAEIWEMKGKIYELKRISETREISIGKVIRGLFRRLDHVAHCQITQAFAHKHRDKFEKLMEKYLKCEEELKTTTLKLQDSEKENKKLESEARKEKIRHYCGMLRFDFEDYDAEIKELEGKISELEKESEMLELSIGSTSYTQVIRGLCLTLDHVLRSQKLFSPSGYKRLNI